MVDNVVRERVDVKMAEATVGEWRVAVGDRIEAGQALVELITDKVTFDYESPVTGTVRLLAAAPGSVAPVGYVLCQIGETAAALPAIDEHNRALIAEHKRRQEVAIAADTTAAPRPVVASERVRATPAARRLAKQHDLALSLVSPSEPGGIVSEADVERYLASHE